MEGHGVGRLVASTDPAPHLGCQAATQAAAKVKKPLTPNDFCVTRGKADYDVR